VSCILDASALLALLLNEPGGEKVRAELPDAVITTVNLSEVVAHYARNGVSESDIHQVLDPLPFERRPFDHDLAFECGAMISVTQSAGLSLGDRACLALAKRMALRALTADRSWVTVSKELGVTVELLR
jgi:ribonuclease VapC